MKSISPRCIVCIIGIALLAIVVYFSTTTGGLFLGAIVVALITAALYYGGFRLDRLLKGGY